MLTQCGFWQTDDVLWQFSFQIKNGQRVYVLFSYTKTLSLLLIYVDAISRSQIHCIAVLLLCCNSDQFH